MITNVISAGPSPSSASWAQTRCCGPKPTRWPKGVSPSALAVVSALLAYSSRNPVSTSTRSPRSVVIRNPGIPITRPAPTAKVPRSRICNETGWPCRIMQHRIPGKAKPRYCFGKEPSHAQISFTVRQKPQHAGWPCQNCWSHRWRQLRHVERHRPDRQGRKQIRSTAPPAQSPYHLWRADRKSHGRSAG